MPAGSAATAVPATKAADNAMHFHFIAKSSWLATSVVFRYRPARRFGLLRKNPIGQIFQLLRVLRFDDRMLFLAAIAELHLRTGAYKFNQLLLAVGFALILGRHLLIRGPGLGLVDRMTRQAAALLCQRLRGFGIDVGGRGRERNKQ